MFLKFLSNSRSDMAFFTLIKNVFSLFWNEYAIETLLLLRHGQYIMRKAVFIFLVESTNFFLFSGRPVRWGIQNL